MIIVPLWSADRMGSVRLEQLKLVAPHMTSFVDAMRAALQSRLWERSQPAESSGQAHTSTPPGVAGGVTKEGTLVDSQLVDMLVAMGFPKHRAAQAALKTGNTGDVHSHSVCWTSCIVFSNLAPFSFSLLLPFILFVLLSCLFVSFFFLSFFVFTAHQRQLTDDIAVTRSIDTTETPSSHTGDTFLCVHCICLPNAQLSHDYGIYCFIVV